MGQQVYDTLILSDVHLGAEMSRARDATRMLKETPSVVSSFWATSLPT